MLLTVCFAACSEDGKDVSDNSVKVVATDTTEIPALGGKGSVTVDKPVTSAYAKDSWLNVTTDGQTVSFSADKYTERESRLTELVIKASADDSTIVSVKQYGYIFNGESVKEITVISDEVDSLIPVYSTEKVTVKSVPSWIKATVKDNGIQLNIAENTTGALRTGVITYGASGYTASVTVHQKKIPAEFGQYYLYGTGITDYDASGKPIEGVVSYQCTLTWTGLVSNQFGIIPGTFDDETSTFTFYNGKSMDYSVKFQDGTIGYLYVMTVGLNDGKQTIGLNPSSYGSFHISYNQQAGVYTSKIQGIYNQELQVPTVGIWFGVFAPKDFSSSNYKGYYNYLLNAQLQSISSSASSKRLATNPANNAITASKKLNITKLNLTK